MLYIVATLRLPLQFKRHLWDPCFLPSAKLSSKYVCLRRGRKESMEVDVYMRVMMVHFKVSEIQGNPCTHFKGKWVH